MNKFFLSLLLILTDVFFLFLNVNAQKKLNVIISIPPSYDTGRVELFLDLGNGDTRIAKSEFKGHTIVLLKNFYSIYATVTIGYNNKKGLYSRSIFFISNKPASITFLETPQETLDSSLTINALTFWKAGMENLYSFATKELNKEDNFIKQNNGNIGGDSLMKIWNLISENVIRKKLEFISKYGSLYYSLWLFRTNFAANTEYSPDSLLGIFQKAFPQKFKKSYDGNTILTILKGRINTNAGQEAPDFVSTDIYGKKLSLKQYRGKYVLLDFWASWCVPCIAELPAIANIRDSIPGNKLEIILASYDEDSSKFINTVKKYNLNYDMIFGDHVLINKYGNKGAIPQTYLIDPYGKLIYSRNDEKDFDLNFLRKILYHKLQ